MGCKNLRHLGENKMNELWTHQKDAVLRAAPLPGFALFFEMGTGKTRTTIEILHSKFAAQMRPLRTIIFCPPVVVSNWKDEWSKFSKMPGRSVIPLTGTGRRRQKMFIDNAFGAEPKIFITNYESLLMPTLFSDMVRWRPEAIVFDESHKLKAHDTQRSKAAEKLSNPLHGERPLVYLLSGSPVLNTPMDIFQQYKILDGGETFGKNFFSFRAVYFRDRNQGMPSARHFPKWEIRNLEKDGFDGVGEINRRIFAKASRVEKKDCLDLPPEVSTTIRVEMSADQAQCYEEMKRELITYYRDKACVARLALVKALRLMQITSGFLSVENPTPEIEDQQLQIQFPNVPKIRALHELLSECLEQGKKPIVWAVWRENYRQIKAVLDSLKIDYAEVHGGVTANQKTENIKRFQNDPDCRVYLGHPGSGGIGVNLTCSDTSIFFSRTFSLEHYLQARARNHRGGSKEAGHQKITHFDLVCGETIDEFAVETLADKLDMSESLLNDMIRKLRS